MRDARGADAAARAGDHGHPAGEVEAVARIVHDPSSASRTAPPKATGKDLVALVARVDAVGQMVGLEQAAALAPA